MQASLDDSDQKTSGTMQMAGCKVIVRPKAFEQQVLAWRLATFALWLFITGTWAVLPYPAACRVGLSLNQPAKFAVTARLGIFFRHPAGLMATDPEPFSNRMSGWLIR